MKQTHIYQPNHGTRHHIAPETGHTADTACKCRSSRR